MEQTMENVKTRYEEACESFGVSPDMDESMPLGKYEGEPKEILYFYESMMNGDGEPVYSGEDLVADQFELSAEERKAFGPFSWNGPVFAVLWHSDQGFETLEFRSEPVESEDIESEE